MSGSSEGKSPAPAWFTLLARAGALLIALLAGAYLYFFSSR